MVGFVLVLAFLLLLVTFRSIVVPLNAIALNLLAVGASTGVLVLVFQHHWAESVLGFHSNGSIVFWLPLFLFVVLPADSNGCPEPGPPERAAANRPPACR